MNRLHQFVLCQGLFVLVMAIVIPAVAVAMDADELIAKYLDAMGGKERLKAVTSQKATGKFLAQGMEFPFTMVSKRPDLMRIDATVMGMEMVQCYDGKKGWAINPMAGGTDAQIMGEMERKGFKLQADMDGPLLDHAAKGYKVEYLGEDDVEGTPTYKLRVDTGQDIVIVMYFDTEYFLPIRQDVKLTFDGNEHESQSYLSDYQEIDGMPVPFATESRVGGVVANQIMLESLERNVEVDDTIFDMPAKAEAPTDTTQE